MSRPQLKKEPVTQQHIEEYLKTTDDFQLEIDIFRSCREAGFSAEHGGSYRDPVTGLNRQFDIRAKYSTGNQFLRLAIECKNLGENFPLLVSTIPRRKGENLCHGIVSAPGSGGSRYALFEITDGLFSKGAPVGKSTAQVGLKNDGAFYSGDSEVYEKWAQAIASCHDLVKMACNDYRATPHKWAGTVVLPVLVVADKTLWIAEYGDSGAQTNKPRHVDETSIYLGTTVHTQGNGFEIQYPLSHLLVFTKTGFLDFLRRFSNDGMVRDYLIPDFSYLNEKARRAFPDFVG